MPDDVALEKVNALRCLGATVERVRPASIVDTKHVRPLYGLSLLHAESRILFGFSTWYDVCPQISDANGADHTRLQ